VTHRFITLTNPVAGREAEYAAWYADRHIKDMLTIPGVLGGQFFEAAVPTGARWRHLAVYEIEAGGIDGIFAEVGRRRGSPRMPLTSAMDGSTLMFMIAVPIAGWVTAEGASPQAGDGANCRLVALGSPLVGREADFERWYVEQHLPDMLRMPGFVGAQRFRIEPSGRGTAPSWKHLALYAAESDAPERLLDELRTRAGTPAMRLSDALDRTAGMTAVFVAATPHLQADAAA
jgi:hypothetical protein